MFDSPAIAHEWQAWAPKLSQVCQISDGLTGGVNVGDRRALFYLARGFRPARVLEIGTHVGASTVHLAAALIAASPLACLISVDVEDVAGPQAVWRRAGLAKSPRQMIDALNGKLDTRFVTDDSRVFLRTPTRDSISSSSAIIRRKPFTRRLIGALDVIAENGLVVLHDYFPDGRALWPDGVVIPGPFAAVEKLRSTGFAIKAVPLGSLPWLTKRCAPR